MRVTLLPLDVGFDLRVHGMEVHLPANVEEVDYLDREGTEQTASGSISRICQELRDHGYNVLNVGDGQ